MELEKNKVTISKVSGELETNLKNQKGQGEIDFFSIQNLKLVTTQ